MRGNATAGGQAFSARLERDNGAAHSPCWVVARSVDEKFSRHAALIGGRHLKAVATQMDTPRDNPKDG
jgi:hypothetical protein